MLPLNVNTIPFNAHHPSGFSRKGDDRAEALDGAINSLQLAVANQDLPTRLPSQGQHYSPDITFLSRHLLSDAMWSTLTTLGSDHLPITVTLSSHAPTGRGKCVLLQTSARPNGRHSQKSQRGTSLRHHCQPPALLKEKSSGVFSATPEDTISPHPLRLCSRLLQSLLTALPTPSATGPFCASWAARSLPPPPPKKKHLNRLQGKNPLQLEGDCTSLNRQFTA